MSKNGSSVLSTSPTSICSLAWYGVPWTRFWSSATNLKTKFSTYKYVLQFRGNFISSDIDLLYLVSISHATTFFTLSRSLIVMLPVPGPISRATSVGLRPDLSSIEVIMSGFFRICWPKSLLNWIPKTRKQIKFYFQQNNTYLSNKYKYIKKKTISN